MSWIMSSKLFDDTPKHISFCIGAIEVCSFEFLRPSMLADGTKRWPVRGYFGRNEHQTFSSLSEGMADMHRRLNSPAPEGYNTGRLFPVKEEVNG